AQHHLEAHGVLLVHLRHRGTLAQARVHVLAPVAQCRKPGVVVDPGAAPLQLLIGHLKIAGQLPRCPLHAVAQADRLHRRARQRGPVRAMIRSAISWASSSRSESISTSGKLPSSSPSIFRISVMIWRANTALPAPIKVILGIFLLDPRCCTGGLSTTAS